MLERKDKKMKKTSKILLSALAVSSMFLTISVNAEELTPTPSEIQTNQAVQETTTTKSIDNLTQEELNTIIPSEIEITTTKTDVANYFANTENNPDLENPAEKAQIGRAHV